MQRKPAVSYQNNKIMQDNITLVFSTFTLISHIAFALAIAYFLVEKSFKNWVYKFVNKNALILIFTASLSAMVGSLIYSNVIGFPPCELCWIQRIFMYPQVLLSFMAMRKNDKSMVSYLLPLSVLGALVSLYHSMTHYGLGDGVLACTSALGDCGKLYVFKFGYITIPLMAFTVFVYLLTISFLYYKSTKERI